MMLTPLIYGSELVGRNESVLGPIRESSVRRNLQCGITGMRLYSEGHCMQVLEGDEPPVLETYQRVWHDPRHDCITLLHADPVPARCFARWTYSNCFVTARSERPLNLK